MPYPFGQPLTSKGKTLSSIRERLVFELGHRTDVAQERWNEWINDAYIDMCASMDIAELKDSINIDTVPSVEFLALPDGLFTIRGVSVQEGPSLSEGYGLIKMDVDMYRKSYLRTGAPTHYVREKDLLVLYPTPTGVYLITVDITIQPMPLVNDTDSPILPLALHEPLFYLAKQKSAEGLGMMSDAQIAGSKAGSLINRKRNPEAVERQNMPAGFRPAFSEQDLIRRERRF